MLLARALRSARPAARATRSVASFVQQYNELVDGGRLVPDRQQARAAMRLERLRTLLQDYTPPPRPCLEQEQHEQPEDDQPETADTPDTPDHPNTFEKPRGVYLYGSVGSGKTMLMDLLADTAEADPAAAGPALRRTHFHEFMGDVHARLHQTRQQLLESRGRSVHIDRRPESNAVALVAHDLADEATVLCLDEVQVTDVADAMVLRQLFSVLFERGVVLVATSNREPSRLYEDGQNREYFEPFTRQLEAHCHVLPLDAADYRLAHQPVPAQFFHPLTPESSRALDAVWAELAQGDEPVGVSMPVGFGRQRVVPRVARGACRFTFDELCGAQNDMGALDFAALANNFHTLVLERIPVLTAAQQNEARRLILLIDILYDKRTRFVASAAASPAALFQVETPVGTASEPAVVVLESTDALDPAAGTSAAERAEKAATRELAFAFRRAASRMHEMRGVGYLEQHAYAYARIYEHYGTELMSPV